MNCRTLVPLAVVLTCLSTRVHGGGSWNSPVSGLEDAGPEPNAAELVLAARKGEMWLHQCESLHIRVRGRWTTTPETVAKRRAEVEKEYGVRDPDPKLFPNVRATSEQSLEFAVDRRRVRYLTHDPGYWRQLKVWDGNELRIHEKYFHRTQEQYILYKEIPARMFHELLPCFYGWPRSQPHSFWYDPRDVNNTMGIYGRAERFKLVGRETYRETPCYVLECQVPDSGVADLGWRWFVGRSDGLLYGIQTLREGRPSSEHWWSEYCEVMPGGWFPRKSSWCLRRPDGAGRMQIESTCNLEVTEFHLDEPLADELFVLPIEPGVEVADNRSGKLKRYKLDKVWPSLLGKEVPDFTGIRLASVPPAKGKPLLIVFVDMENRPSRHALQELAAPERSSLRERVEVIPVQMAQAASEKLGEWRKTLSLPWEIATITSDPDTIRWSWGAKSLPWLILADRDHIVQAEGFSLDELDERIKQVCGE